MKLVTYSPAGGGAQRPGLVVDGDRIVDIPAHAAATPGVDFSTMLGIIRGGAAARKALDALAARPPAATVSMKDVKLHAPIPRPAKNVFCVGWNYLEHFEEGAKKLQDNRELPQWPVFFSKAPTAVNGPYDPIPFDASISTSLDWEVELGVVIGTRARYVSEADALKHVAGYCTINDISEREYQLERGGTWDKGKGCDTFGPIGPWLVSADEVGDPQNLAMWLDVNGERQQTGSTRTMIFTVAQLVSYLSRFMTLEPGDLITTGTPPGVGMGKKPAPQYLKPGDVITLGIEKLGDQRQTVFAWAPQLIDG